MEIENNNARDFKDLEEMPRNSKSLKRNDRERKGILIAPLKLPRLSHRSIPYSNDVLSGSRLQAQILRRGWQADREALDPTNSGFGLSTVPHFKIGDEKRISQHLFEPQRFWPAVSKANCGRRDGYSQHRGRIFPIASGPRLHPSICSVAF